MQTPDSIQRSVAQYGSRVTKHLEQLLNEGILRLAPALLQRPGNESVRVLQEHMPKGQLERVV